MATAKMGWPKALQPGDKGRVERRGYGSLAVALLLAKVHGYRPFSALGTSCTLTRSGGVQKPVPFPVP